MQKVFSIFIICLLLQACNSKNRNIEVVSNELVMYEPSEMTILMRRIHEVNKVVKDQIIKRDSLLIFPEEFTEIFSATLTDSTERDDKFIILARSFIDLQKMTFSSYSDSTVYNFNQSINNCVECHRTRCPGPIPEIKKLLIN
jgi:hypothetical protein